MAMGKQSLTLGTFGELVWDDAGGQFTGRYRLVDGEEIALSVDPFTDQVPSKRPSVVPEPEALAKAVADRVGPSRRPDERTENVRHSGAIADIQRG
jgi:hypothetical protein